MHPADILDPGETNDLADAEPKKLKELVDLWMERAGKRCLASSGMTGVSEQSIRRTVSQARCMWF
jgi:hypothetical protein